MFARSKSQSMAVLRCFLASLAIVSPAVLSAKSGEFERPNVLIVMTDDQSYPHASAYGTNWVRTPSFDRIAASGALIHNGFVSAPSCGPSRAALLTGQDFYRLGPTSMNHMIWQKGTLTVTDHLIRVGYGAGFTGKGWAPGNFRNGGRSISPTGALFNAATAKQPGSGVTKIDYSANFDSFLDQNGNKPFIFWVGINEPHRPVANGVAARSGKSISDGDVPGWLPQNSAVRDDVADYAYEIEWADSELGQILDRLAKEGRLDNTLIIFTADNGMPFPRAKGTLYDAGTHMPMAIAWPKGFRGKQQLDQFVSTPDFGATIMAAAGLTIPSEMTGQNLLPLLRGTAAGKRKFVVMGMERHFPGGRADGGGYPVRAIRTGEWLYIRNYAPNANPAGDLNGIVWPDDDPTGGFGDVDGNPTKTVIVQQRDQFPDFYQRAFGKRPAEELYSLKDDPAQFTNLAGDPSFARQKKKLAAQMDAYLTRTGDPRALGRGADFDAWMRRYPVMGANEAGLQ